MDTVTPICYTKFKPATRPRLLPPDIAVVEMTDAFRQPSLFYHLGVRESFSMANNIILYCDTNSDSLQSLQVQWADATERARDRVTAAHKPHSHPGSQRCWLKAIFRRRQGVDSSMMWWQQQQQLMNVSAMWWKEMLEDSFENQRWPHSVLDRHIYISHLF